MEKIILESIELSEFLDLIRQIVKEEIANSKLADLKDSMLSGEEARKLFRPPVSSPTLVQWSKSGRITQYRIGRKVYYKYNEVLEAAKSFKRYKR